MNQEKIERMKGRVITEIMVSDDREIVYFSFVNGEDVSFTAYGDCCSYSWIEHFDEIKEPEIVVDFIEIDIAPYEPVEKSKYIDNPDCIDYYFYKLITDKSSYLIEMRNNSNGYYGGWLE